MDAWQADLQDAMTIETLDGNYVIRPPRNLIIEIPEGGQFILKNTFWEDLRFPASGINPPGAASDPTVDTTDGRLVFSASAENIVAIQVQMPHAWREGSTIHPHIHWSPTSTNTGNVKWQLKYKVANINEVFPAEWTTITALQAGAGVSDTHQIVDFEDNLPMPGKTFSCMLLLLISRLGNDAADTYTGTAKLNEIDIHYEINGFGTSNEYSR
jgi:hypothetical protein